MQLKFPVLLKYEEPYHSNVIWPDDLPFPSDAKDGDRHFEMQTQGPWQTLVNLRALVIEKRDDGVLIYGDRNMRFPHECGTTQFGRVSVAGRKRRAFTSDMLVTYNGKLHNFAVLYLCTEKNK